MTLYPISLRFLTAKSHFHAPIIKCSFQITGRSQPVTNKPRMIGKKAVTAFSPGESHSGLLYVGLFQVTIARTDENWIFPPLRDLKKNDTNLSLGL